jgi:dTDP-4-dehydrorhamnose reductase
MHLLILGAAGMLGRKLAERVAATARSAASLWTA